MNTRSGGGRLEQPRACGIAANLGDEVACPEAGCALLHALGEEIPEDPQAVCPIEKLAHGDRGLVRWTLNELRQRMERDPAGWQNSLRSERSDARRQVAALRPQP
jgi:hypothetical protein